MSDGLGGESSRGLGEVERMRRSAGCVREEQDKRRDGGRERGGGGGGGRRRSEERAHFGIQVSGCLDGGTNRVERLRSSEGVLEEHERKIEPISSSWLQVEWVSSLSLLSLLSLHSPVSAAASQPSLRTPMSRPPSSPFQPRESRVRREGGCELRLFTRTQLDFKKNESTTVGSDFPAPTRSLPPVSPVLDSMHRLSRAARKMIRLTSNAETDSPGKNEVALVEGVATLRAGVVAARGLAADLIENDARERREMVILVVGLKS